MYTRISNLAGDGVLSSIRRDADGAVIPDDPENLDWQAYEAWVAAGNTPADPPPSIASAQLSFLGFMALFSVTEQAAIVSSIDPRIKLFCLMAAGAEYVDLADPRVVSGTHLLESLGLIGEGRAVQVLASQAPPAS